MELKFGTIDFEIIPNEDLLSSYTHVRFYLLITLEYKGFVLNFSFEVNFVISSNKFS